MNEVAGYWHASCDTLRNLFQVVKCIATVNIKLERWKLLPKIELPQQHNYQLKTCNISNFSIQQTNVQLHHIASVILHFPSEVSPFLTSQGAWTMTQQ